MAQMTVNTRPTLTTLQQEILNFLRTFEKIQEDLRLGSVLEARRNWSPRSATPSVASTRLSLRLRRPNR